jgi:hypothetical protein
MKLKSQQKMKRSRIEINKWSELTDLKEISIGESFELQIGLIVYICQKISDQKIKVPTINVFEDTPTKEVNLIH